MSKVRCRVSLVACEAASSPPDGAPATVAESESSADAEAMRAAEDTLRAFFAVKRQAQDDLSVMIAAQAAYLTARDVHPCPVEGTELQLDPGSPGESCWNGTATLENRDGEWLIDDHEPAWCLRTGSMSDERIA